MKRAGRLRVSFPHGCSSWLAAALIVFPLVARAGEPTAAGLSPASQKRIDFVRDIQPILALHCYACHGPDKQENELRWDTRASALKGGTSGPALVPGNSAESRVIRLVAGLEKGLVMPKRGARLTPEQIGLLRAWIDQGATWPDAAAEPKPADKRDWWSFKPATRPAVPAFKANKWIRNPIDAFILAKLEESGLKPTHEADRRTLIRRLSFDLTGLPPSPEETAAFLADRRPDAYEQLVDHLLASPRYGERWARHWLDTVHYGDTHGYDKDKLRPNAWPYRDFVIRALNEDMPYPMFVSAQLAADVLFPQEPELIAALGFIAAGPWDFVGHLELPIEKTDGLIARYNDRDDMVMTTVSTFESLTVHCARCHDHKFDPIKQRDYYSLQSVFAGVDRADRPFDRDPSVFSRRSALLHSKKTLEDQYIALTNRMWNLPGHDITELNAQLDTVRQKRLEASNEIETEPSPGNGYRSLSASNRDTIKWVQADLGRSMPLDEVRLYPARPVDVADTLGYGFPLRFKVEASDDADFSNSQTLADYTGTDFNHRGDDAVTISARGRRSRYVRVTVTRLAEAGRSFLFALAEMQVMTGGTNAAYGTEVTASDSLEEGYWSKRLLVDGFDSRRRLPDFPPTEKSRAKEGLDAEVKALVEERNQLIELRSGQPWRDQLEEITNHIEQVDRDLKALPPPEMVYAGANYFPENGEFKPARVPRPVFLLARGDVKRPGDPMLPAGLPAVSGPASDLTTYVSLQSSAASGSPPASVDFAEEGPRRAALARWITDPQNMLTRRSIVNRVWHYHFGRGLVDTPNDFGRMGATPTHPELLDWLAFWFLDHGESLKALHRLIVTSATYRQASDGPAEAPSANPTSSTPRRHTKDGAANPPVSPMQIDADNRYLWRMNRTRLDAETIRDSMLFVAGKLDLTMGGPPVQQFYFKEDHSPVYDYGLFDPDGPGGRRRSIYRCIVRSVPDPLMETLDCPDPSLLTPKRNTTLTSLQALAILNDPFVLKQCQHLAERVAAAPNLDEQISMAYELTLNRRPTPAESAKLHDFASRYGMVNLCRVLFNTSEFMFVD